MSTLTFSLQALIVRHESYIVDSQRERKTMAMQIETLEMEKRTLERRNAATIEENRLLLDQLESVNNAEAESDEHLTNLQATLEATQQELSRLQGLAARTDSLERQIADFEREQMSWQTTLESKEESEKTAVRRWQQAERTLDGLQDQIERIEREAQDERQRHGDVVERMERRYAVERELGSAAGRLKGAAALKSNGKDPGGSNVVSHFVKDILQDNANLQTGIVELRDMLNTSNEEVEKLRNQLVLHQSNDETSELTPKAHRNNDLKTEMTRANSQELHVHHHYHAPSTPNAPKTIRKKKRGFVPGHQTPPSGFGTPRSSFSQSTSTSLTTILQQTSASVPQPIPEGKRWSTQSSQNYASLASSPQSTTNRAPSLSERVFSDGGHESSRASTPDTEDFGSPGFGPSHFRKPSAGSSRAYSAPIIQRRSYGRLDVGPPTFDIVPSMDDPPRLDLQYNDHHTIPEENEAHWENVTSNVVEGEDTLVLSPRKTAFDAAQPHSPGHKLRRTASHESVFSVAAMDIHTLKSRPSQLLGSYGNRSITTEAVISDTNVHATRPIAVSRMSENSRMMLSGLALDTRQSSSKPTLGRKVGGWVFGKWGGAAPTTTAQADLTSSASPATTTKTKDKAASISTSSVKSGGDEVPSTPKNFVIRSAGINQNGPILGFRPEIKIQHAPIVKQLDADALRTALGHD